jgi:hypothetical protein
MNASTNPYAGHRYPAEIISHNVWLYHTEGGGLYNGIHQQEESTPSTPMLPPTMMSLPT